MNYRLSRIGGLVAGLLVVGGLVAGCSMAPDYETPVMPAPAAFKEVGEWKQATPLDSLPKGAWWSVFADAKLDVLEARLGEANQDLKIAYARFLQARATADAVRGDSLPTVSASASSVRTQRSRTTASVQKPRDYSDHALSLNLSYEIDLWGRVRNAVEAGDERAEASAADLASVGLSLQAELAADYFDLRGADEQQVILDQTVDSYDKALTLTRSRYAGGVAAEIDVAQAEAQLETAKTQASENRLKRIQLEHAIAILIGEQPSSFGLATMPLAAVPPMIDPGLPSHLLERRPDVAAAERRVAAANADIGVARAAF